MPSASPYLERKTTVPSPMVTRDWDCVSAQIRERAFFMAGVTDARILGKFRECVEAITRGDMSGVEARRQLREHLKEIGYSPDDPAEVGTIKDLGTTQRMKVALDTNVQMAHGWAQHQEDLRDEMNPAQELWRKGARRVPRDWPARWAEAAQEVGFDGVATQGGRMVALTASPIWAALSRFGNPFPPFDFNSGMGTRPVDYDTAVALGCFGPPSAPTPSPDDAPESTTDDAPAEPEQPARQSLNHGLEMETGVPPNMEAELQRALDGIAEVENGMARALDVNGTTPLSPERAGEVIGRTMPDGVPNLQADAYTLHSNDPAALEREGPKAMENLQNLVDRIEKTPYTAAGDAGRVLRLDDAGFQKILAEMDKSGTYSAKRGRVAESWAAAASCPAYATGKNNVILIAKKYRSRVMAESLDKALGLMTEKGNSLFSARVKWRITRKVSDTRNAHGGHDVTFEVEEAE